MRNPSIAFAVAVALLGCSKKDEAPAPTKQPPEAAAKPQQPPPPALTPPDAAPSPPADALVEHDLSSQGAAWAGWTVKAPADGKLESNDGTVKGGIAIRWGNGAGAMGFAHDKIDFKARKHDFGVTGDTKVDRETADQLDATLTMMGTPLKCFYQNRTIDGKPLACWTVSCVSDDAELAKAHAICDSLARR
jgi:hypothetical protein